MVTVEIIKRDMNFYTGVSGALLEEDDYLLSEVELVAAFTSGDRQVFIEGTLELTSSGSYGYPSGVLMEDWFVTGDSMEAELIDSLSGIVYG